MKRPARISNQTRINWLIDAVVFIGGLAASLTGIYFLFFTSGGYQGGRNSLYGVTLFFARESWSDFHIWTGVLMIAAIIIHFVYHWNWVKMMARRVVKIVRGQNIQFSRGAKVNVAIDLLIAISFISVAFSGLYFLFTPSGGFQGGNNPSWDPGFLFSRTTWDLIHTWAGVTMIVAAVVHFAIHWRWVLNVTKRFFQTLRPSFLTPQRITVRN